MSPLWRRAGQLLMHAAARPVSAALLMVMLALGSTPFVFAQESTPEATAEVVAEVTPEATAEVTEVPAPTTDAPEATAEATDAPIALNIVGSGIAAQLFQALAEQVGFPQTVNVNGTTTGISEFCAGTADATLANRPMTTEEEAFCTAAAITYYEVVIGHSTAAVIANTSVDFETCIPSGVLPTFFAPSVTSSNWTQINVNNPDLPLIVALPPINSPSYAIIDGLVEGDGLRADVTPLADEAAVIESVSANAGGVGIISLQAATAAQAAGASIKTFEIDFGEAGCAAPSAENVEGRTYNASAPLIVYVNANALPALMPILDAALGENGAATVTAANFTPITAELAAEQEAALANGTTGRVYSRTVTTFEISPQVTGVITVGGTASNSAYVTNLISSFTGQYPGVTSTPTFEGSVAGARRFCNGELDILTVTAPLTAEQEANCTANQITPYPITLGRQSAVLISNSESEFLTCLTTAQLGTVLGSAAQDTINTWNQVDASFPETPITVFTGSLGGETHNIALLRTIGGANPGRADIEVNEDPLYRAAAVANVEGAIALLSWSEYQQVVESGQQGISLVSIDGGTGCVTPDETTIGDGTYALTQPLLLIVNRAAFAKPQVQSLLWFMLSDENYIALQSLDLVGLRFGDLPELRANLQETYTLVAQEVAAAVAEATPEATAEATTQP